jgi:hypothetical protein
VSADVKIDAFQSWIHPGPNAVLPRGAFTGQTSKIIDVRAHDAPNSLLSIVRTWTVRGKPGKPASNRWRKL